MISFSFFAAAEPELLHVFNFYMTASRFKNAGVTEPPDHARHLHARKSHGCGDLAVREVQNVLRRRAALVKQVQKAAHAEFR